MHLDWCIEENYAASLNSLICAFFLILMRTRSLSASGEAAHLTTSAVSLRLRKLEDGIGAQLFTRTGKGLVPTEAGTALAEAAVPILAEAAALDARLNRFSKHDPEPLRIFQTAQGWVEFSLPNRGRLSARKFKFPRRIN